MCGLCGAFGNEEHWSSGTGAKEASGVETRRASRERLEQINCILKHFRIKVTSWQNTSYLLQGSTGKQNIVNSLAGIWSEAEKMSGLLIDPLDPQLLQKL